MSQRALRGLAVGGLAGVALLPLLPVLAQVVPPLRVLKAWLEPWFAFQCERDSGRTLEIAGVALAVCARCSGIYFGVGLGALIRRPMLATRTLRLWMLGAALLMLVDVVVERAGWHAPWAPLRVLTGVLLAYPLGVGLGVLVSRAPRRP